MAHAGPIDGEAPDRPCKLNEERRRALARMVESGPIPAIRGVVRWRRKGLARCLFEAFRIETDEAAGREPKAPGFAKLSARLRQDGFPRTGEDPGQSAGGHRKGAVAARRSQDRTENKSSRAGEADVSSATHLSLALAHEDERT